MSYSPAPHTAGRPQEADAPDTQDVCVLFGALRSGTTMLRLMINGHPQLLCPGETDFLTDYLVLTPGGGWRYDLESLAENRIFRDSRAKLPDTAEAGPAFRSMVADLRDGDSGTLVLVLHRGLERLLDLVPDIPVLHLVRDPRDVARSAIGMGWAGHVYYGARIWLQSEEAWERVATRLAEDQSLELRYEPLVHNPEAVLGEICNFLGKRYDSAMLSYSERSTYDRPDPSLTEQWRKKWSPHELSVTEPLFGDLLVRRGYKPSGQPATSPSRATRLAMWAANKHLIWRFRIKKFGLRDPLVAALASRVGLPQLAISAQRRMQEIIRKSLK